MTTRNEVTPFSEKTFTDNNNTDVANKNGPPGHNDVVLNDLPKSNDVDGVYGGDAGSVGRRSTDVEAQERPTLHFDDIGPPPDGGLTAWLVVMSTMFLQFCVFGLSESPAFCSH